nr:fimbria/pilus outer membrane usher protein [Rahnella aceris]
MTTRMKMSHLGMMIGLACMSGQAGAREWKFDASMLGGSARDADVSVFNQGGQPPGTYTVDVLVNGERVDTRDVVFSLEKDEKGRPFLLPCISVEDLARYGVKTEEYPGLMANGACADLSAIPQAAYDFQFGNQQLALSIPQVSLRPQQSGIAPQVLWDDGMPALLMNYSANTTHMEQRGGYDGQTNSDSSYVQLSPGANLGAWRLRNQTNWSKQSEASGKWQTVYTYAERGLYDMKSRVTLGDRYTSGDVFDSVPFRGVMLASDDNMVPYTQRSFAPVVRGIARTQARVEVRQNGYTVYNATVAPGPFALSDLALSGASGGDLEVTVWETDGVTQVFTVPYQTPAISLKEGYLEYNLMTGQYRPADSSVDKKMIGQATVMYGLPWDLTVYAGGQGAEHFQAGTFGLGLSMGDWGAVSLDGTGSKGQRRSYDTETGTAWRMRYSKDVIATNTTFSMTSYQYQSAGYNTMSDVLDTWGNGGGDPWEDNEWYTDRSDRRKSTTSVMLTQTMGEWGSLSLNGSRDNYWNRSGYDNNFGIGYGVGLFRGITMSVNWSENKQINNDGEKRNNRTTSLWFRVPLDRLMGGNTAATYRMTSPSQGADTQEVGLNGRAFDQQLDWDVREQHTSGSTTNGADNAYLNTGWNGTYGRIGGNYSYSQHLRQMGADLSGGIVAHPNGVTLGQTMGDTVAVVEAPGAAGVPVYGGAGVRTDFRGYTLQNWLTPYQENTVSLDPLNLPADVDITQTDVKLVPTQGAVIAAKFATRTGGRALMVLTQADGKSVPFGAVVALESQGGVAGIVGDGGQVYLTGLPDSAELLVKWSGRECRVNYRLQDVQQVSGLYSLKGFCR